MFPVTWGLKRKFAAGILDIGFLTNALASTKDSRSAAVAGRMSDMMAKMTIAWGKVYIACVF